MPLSGAGVLVTLMDIDPENEAEFNRWYDKEHLIERVSVPGFLEARRYEAVNAAPKYLNLYTTIVPELLTSKSYQEVLRNQTDWSKRVISMFRNRIRGVLRVMASRGQGRGGHALWVRLNVEHADQRRFEETLVPSLEAGIGRDTIISAHLLFNETPPGELAEYFVLIDGTSNSELERFGGEAFGGLATVVSSGSYKLLWDLSKGELEMQ
jgi:hypothetical protein